MTLLDSVALLRRSWRTLLLGLLIGVSCASLAALLSPPTYTASSQMYVTATSAESPSDLFQGTSYAEMVVHDFAQLATSPYVISQVRSNLKLRQPLSEITSRVSISVPDDTAVLSIQATGSDPRSAVELANAVTSTLRRAALGLVPGQSAPVEPVKITIIGSASTSDVSSAPSAIPLALVGGAGGLVLAMLATFLVQGYRRRLLTVDETTTVTGGPVFLYRNSGRRSVDRAVIDATAAASAVQQLARHISPDKLLDVVLVSSPKLRIREEFLLNVATGLARRDVSTLLVERERAAASRALGGSGELTLNELAERGGDLTRAATEAHDFPALKIAAIGSLKRYGSVEFATDQLVSAEQQLPAVVLRTHPLEDPLTLNGLASAASGPAVILLLRLGHSSEREVTALITHVATIDGSLTAVVLTQ